MTSRDVIITRVNDNHRQLVSLYTESWTKLNRKMENLSEEATFNVIDILPICVGSHFQHTHTHTDMLYSVQRVLCICEQFEKRPSPLPPPPLYDQLYGRQIAFQQRQPNRMVECIRRTVNYSKFFWSISDSVMAMHTSKIKRKLFSSNWIIQMFSHEKMLQTAVAWHDMAFTIIHRTIRLQCFKVSWRPLRKGKQNDGQKLSNLPWIYIAEIHINTHQPSAHIR